MMLSCRCTAICTIGIGITTAPPAAHRKAYRNRQAHPRLPASPPAHQPAFPSYTPVDRPDLGARTTALENYFTESGLGDFFLSFSSFFPFSINYIGYDEAASLAHLVFRTRAGAC